MSAIETFTHLRPVGITLLKAKNHSPVLRVRTSRISGFHPCMEALKECYRTSTPDDRTVLQATALSKSLTPPDTSPFRQPTPAQQVMQPSTSGTPTPHLTVPPSLLSHLPRSLYTFAQPWDEGFLIFAAVTCRSLRSKPSQLMQEFKPRKTSTPAAIIQDRDASFRELPGW